MQKALFLLKLMSTRLVVLESVAAIDMSKPAFKTKKNRRLSFCSDSRISPKMKGRVQPHYKIVVKAVQQQQVF